MRQTRMRIRLMMAPSGDGSCAMIPVIFLPFWRPPELVMTVRCRRLGISGALLPLLLAGPALVIRLRGGLGLKPAAPEAQQA
jgi:hypothetical protein